MYICDKCKQFEIGQTGEYPCKKCGLPTQWDDGQETLYDIMKMNIELYENLTRVIEKLEETSLLFEKFDKLKKGE